MTDVAIVGFVELLRCRPSCFWGSCARFSGFGVVVLFGGFLEVLVVVFFARSLVVVVV